MHLVRRMRSTASKPMSNFCRTGIAVFNSGVELNQTADLN